MILLYNYTLIWPRKLPSPTKYLIKELAPNKRPPFFLFFFSLLIAPCKLSNGKYRSRNINSAITSYRIMVRMCNRGLQKYIKLFGNYSLVSVLPCLSKILERIKYNRCYGFLCSITFCMMNRVESVQNIF